MWEIVQYKADKKEEWDEFVECSRNATFLFKRDYMDYHSDRFADRSLMAYRNGKLAALLPANIVDNTLWSHQGLTYGGWALTPKGLDAAEIILLWKKWLHYCLKNGVEKVIYKPLPYIYARMPSEEDRYMLFLTRASLVQTDISSTIDLSDNPGFNKLQTRHLKKASQGFFSMKNDCSDPESIEEFHSLLYDCLKERHGARPVHSFVELELLMRRFPENIWVWQGLYEDQEGTHAGVCVYISSKCVHCQYIATSQLGRERDILSALFKEMIEYYTLQGYRYFDFGISNENYGRWLNSGLNRQKTSYGASGTAYQRYEINIAKALVSLPDTCDSEARL